MESKQNIKPIKPKGIRIEITENGVLTTNVRVPYFVVKMGMKFGQMAADSSKKKGSVEDELERLKDVDMDAIFEALNSGELTLPCLLVEVDEPDKNQHVKITLE
ncbi:hypothetical protein CLHOM_12560 [Clostridium homopropionicum DSM 5847]|uniref:Uncharacterized protein n=1 Tax=Clostridium homopropionicum DSM 5847 TaxID=1121318 RepID=A0A0L6ZBI8_9CLOT|nr:hypothetical protein [Clostridium homopropionicum]KOA20344.1 hypothetical protein CLHOM_12560 [Clostridium homopropionicum DSM 5847]SFG94189.1 hypothetical protein SAMN04488501_12529 [Clostridium homopropionicum]